MRNQVERYPISLELVSRNEGVEKVIEAKRRGNAPEAT